MGVTNAGIDHILNAEFASGARVSRWYVGVISGAGTPVLRATDTSASHPGWFEVLFRDNFDNYNRPAWAPQYVAGAMGRPANRGDNIRFSFPGVIYGLFLASSFPQQGTTDLIFATAAFVGGPRSVAKDDTLNTTFWIAASS